MFSIIWEKSVKSTNSELRDRIDTLDNLSVIATWEQLCGRGQGDHRWYSSPRTNLTFSLLAKYPKGLVASESLLITCFTTLGIRDYLLEKGVTAGIKWPNDIWVDGKKICGILIENQLNGIIINSSVIGIGININEKNWPSELPNPVSLLELTGKEYDLEKELELLHNKICLRYRQLESNEGKEKLQEEFRNFLIAQAPKLG